MDVLKGKVARELAALEQELDDFIEGVIGAGLRPPGRADRFRPPTDVYETHDDTVVQMELAGVLPEEVRIVVDGEYLQISGRREPEQPEPPERYVQMEIPRGRFERVLRLGATYDPDRVSASMDAGILRIVLPRRARVVRKIPVRGP